MASPMTFGKPSLEEENAGNIKSGRQTRHIITVTEQMAMFPDACPIKPRGESSIPPGHIVATKQEVCI